MKLESVYRRKDSVGVLYKLLSEREDWQSISHKSMPDLSQHTVFVASRPYFAWYLIIVDEKPVGAIYLTKQREIGVFIFNEFSGNHYGVEAVKLIMEKWPGRFLANVNPSNQRSINLFKQLGFRPLQLTYAI